VIQSHIPYVENRQSMPRPPTEWETELATAIEAAFAKGAWELEALVAALNASWIRPREGGDWTVANFTATLGELGA
jgi:hypothetical protein